MIPKREMREFRRSFLVIFNNKVTQQPQKNHSFRKTNHSCTQKVLSMDKDFVLPKKLT